MLRRPQHAAVACARCGASVVAVPLGSLASPLCERCGRHASHLQANGAPEEHADSNTVDVVEEPSP